MLTSYKKKASILLIAAMGVVVVVSIWDYLAGSGEEWIHYVDSENPSILGNYGSYEECTKHMKSHEGPSGCRRIDGPYSIINSLSDIIL